MYSKVKHLGIHLTTWQVIFNYQYSLGELYQMHVDNSQWPKASNCQSLKDLM